MIIVGTEEEDQESTTIIILEMKKETWVPVFTSTVVHQMLLPHSLGCPYQRKWCNIRWIGEIGSWCMQGKRFDVRNLHYETDLKTRKKHENWWPSVLLYNKHLLVWIIPPEKAHGFWLFFCLAICFLLVWTKSCAFIFSSLW